MGRREMTLRASGGSIFSKKEPEGFFDLSCLKYSRRRHLNLFLRNGAVQ